MWQTHSLHNPCVYELNPWKLIYDVCDVKHCKMLISDVKCWYNIVLTLTISAIANTNSKNMAENGVQSKIIMYMFLLKNWNGYEQIKTIFVNQSHPGHFH